VCGELHLVHIPPSEPSADMLLKTTISPDPAELNHPTEVWRWFLRLDVVQEVRLDGGEVVYQVSVKSVEKWGREDGINPKSGHHLELGHWTAPERTAPFGEFLPVSYGTKIGTWVKDELLTIEAFSLSPDLADKMIFTYFP
jgi:hypothetical protein